MVPVVDKPVRARVRSQQRGAALVMAIAVGAVAVLGWQQRASLSHLLIAQQVLDQATLAASLAAAQHHARLLNAHAFLNRTVMAHQVAMAHLMTVASAEKMRFEMSQRLMRGNPPVYLIGMMFGPSHAAAYAASKMSVAGSSLSGVRELHEAFKAHEQVLTTELKRSRQALLKNIRSDTNEIVKAVLDRNMARQPDQQLDIEYRVQMPLEKLTPVLIEPANRLWRHWFRDTLKRHPYLKTRRQTAKNWWMVNKNCPHMRHHLRRRGESSFEADGLWQVTDTLSFHPVRGFRFVLCYWREYPMGFANVKSNQKGEKAMSWGDQLYGREGAAPENFGKMTFLKWVTSQYSLTAVLHGFSNALADGLGYKSRLRWQPRARVEPYVLASVDDLVTRVYVRQRLDRLDDPLLRLGLRIKGLLRIEANWGEHLSAQAAAQTYFDHYRATANQGASTPHLFQPFWMAKNVLVN
jgi:hypothetical protein